MYKKGTFHFVVFFDTDSLHKKMTGNHLGDLCKEKKFQISEITMEVGGWVTEVSLGIFFFENHPKIALNQY